MKRYLTIFCTLILVSLTGCKHEGELKGDVFIVTKGAQNFKLGLVEVTAIPEADMNQFIWKKKSNISSEFSKLKPQVTAAQKELETAQQDYQATKDAYDVAEVKQKEAQSKVNDLELNAYTSPYESSQTDSDTPEIQAQKTAIADKLKKQSLMASQQAALLSRQLESLRIPLKSKERYLAGIKMRLVDVQNKMTHFITNDFLLVDLPEGIAKATTDADGKFSMKLPNTGKFALAAHSQRRVFDSTEQYYWLVWVSIDAEQAKQVMLTNQNLMGEDSPDSVFITKDLIDTIKLGDSSQML